MTKKSLMTKSCSGYGFCLNEDRLEEGSFDIVITLLSG